MAQEQNQDEAKSESFPPHQPLASSVASDMVVQPTMIPATSWFTPKRLLVIFCLMNLLNYLDRGAIASNGVNGHRATCSGGTCKPGAGIQGDFDLSNFKNGVLSSAFMVGLLLASPIFAILAKSVNPFRLIGIGMSVWTFATLCCGLSFNFLSIAFCRVLVGVGEASFIGLAAPFIDDNAPVSQKTAWLSTFYMCIPGGYAVGYVYGGVVGTNFGWRYAFWVEAILMLPFAILGLVMKPLQLKGLVPADSTEARALETVPLGVQDAEASDGKDESSSMKDIRDKGSHEPSKPKSAIAIFLKDMKELLSEKVFIVNVLGYVAYTFVIGAYSYWGPKACYSIYNMANADMLFGGITIVCGIVGTLAGGFALDYMGSTLSNAFKLLSVTTLVGGAFCFAAFLFRSQYVFLAIFAIGELIVFAPQGPVNYVMLHSVKPSLRPLSMGMSTVAIHIFGDVPSAPLVGLVQDNINNWRTTVLILATIFFPAAAIWFVGVFMHSVDRYNEDSSNEHQVSSTGTSSTAPLLEEKTGQTAPAISQSQHC